MKHRLTVPAIACAVTLLCVPAAWAQTQPVAPTSPPAQASSAAVAATSAKPAAEVPAGLTSKEILDHLTSVNRWYRESQTAATWVLQPADQFYWNQQEVSANEAVKQAFAGAEAAAGLVPDNGKDGSKPAAARPDTQRIQEVLSENQARVDDLKMQLEGVNKQLSGRLAPADREALVAQKGALQDALAIDETFVDFIGQARSLMTGSSVETEQTATMGQIQAIRASARGAFAGTPTGKAAAPAQPAEGDPQGTFAQAELVVRILKDEHEIDTLADDNGTIAKLLAEVDQIRAPLRTMLRDIVQKGQAASDAISQARGTDVVSQQRALSGLAATLRDVTDSLLALRAETMALEQNRSNLNDWKAVIIRHRDVVLRSLVERIIVISVVIAVLAIVSELWRRATFRYVHDLRRRRQLLLIRRVAYGSLIAVVLIMGLVSNLSSLATFAGFITAGIAVASQTIIVSIAAFFFMMGRNGVHVGDRVTVTSSTGSTVTGKVVEIDLVRFSVMELTGSGLDLRPTGRIASYANALLFQTVPFFKHITGADYGWHEIAVPLKPEADFDLVQKLVIDAVNEVYSEYRKILEEQRGLVERTNEITLDVPEPTSQVLYGAKGPELVAGYPIDRTGRISMDLRVARSVREAIAKDKGVACMLSGEPELRGPSKS